MSGRCKSSQQNLNGNDSNEIMRHDGRRGISRSLAFREEPGTRRQLKHYCRKYCEKWECIKGENDLVLS